MRRKFILSYKDYFINESENRMADLKAAVTDIDDNVTFEDGKDGLELTIKIGDIELANRIHKYILQNDDEYKVKSVEASDINDLKVVLKNKDEIKKDEKDIEDKIKKEKGEMDALDATDLTGGTTGTSVDTLNTASTDKQLKGFGF